MTVENAAEPTTEELKELEESAVFMRQRTAGEDTVYTARDSGKILGFLTVDEDGMIGAVCLSRKYNADNTARALIYEALKDNAVLTAYVPMTGRELFEIMTLRGFVIHSAVLDEKTSEIKYEMRLMRSPLFN